MSLKWFVIHAYSGYENQVKKTLLERIEMQGMGCLLYTSDAADEP